MLYSLWLPLPWYFRSVILFMLSTQFVFFVYFFFLSLLSFHSWQIEICLKRNVWIILVAYFSRVYLCIQSGYHPIPAIWFCVDGLNQVLIVLNSSLNFYIYCLVGKRFRTELYSLLRSLFLRSKNSISVGALWKLRAVIQWYMNIWCIN